MKIQHGLYHLLRVWESLLLGNNQAGPRVGDLQLISCVSPKPLRRPGRRWQGCVKESVEWMAEVMKEPMFLAWSQLSVPLLSCLHEIWWHDSHWQLKYGLTNERHFAISLSFSFNIPLKHFSNIWQAWVNLQKPHHLTDDITSIAAYFESAPIIDWFSLPEPSRQESVRNSILFHYLLGSSYLSFTFSWDFKAYHTSWSFQGISRIFRRFEKIERRLLLIFMRFWPIGRWLSQVFMRHPDLAGPTGWRLLTNIYWIWADPMVAIQKYLRYSQTLSRKNHIASDRVYVTCHVYCYCSGCYSMYVTEQMWDLRQMWKQSFQYAFYCVSRS